MLYFILWTLVIVGIAASVPVVSAIENKRRRDALPPAESDELDDATPEAEFGNVGDGDQVEAFDEGTQQKAEVAGQNDFSAFDEEFK